MADIEIEQIRDVLLEFGISRASRAVATDSSEEIILLERTEFAEVDDRALTVALMTVLPHTKVWVIENSPEWTTEPLFGQP